MLREVFERVGRLLRKEDSVSQEEFESLLLLVLYEVNFSVQAIILRVGLFLLWEVEKDVLFVSRESGEKVIQCLLEDLDD